MAVTPADARAADRAPVMKQSLLCYLSLPFTTASSFFYIFNESAPGALTVKCSAHEVRPLPSGLLRRLSSADLCLSLG